MQKKGDINAADVDRTNWYANADQIAFFLASINTFWSMQEWQDMLYHHLQLVEDEAVKRLSGQYAEDIALYDIIEEQALEMADMMSYGIISQFSLR